MKHLRALLMAMVLTMSFISERSQADSSTREFIMSCTYGVLAGTLVGAAMLAFTDQPGENLGKVARGASIGLYTGILLGLYVVYGISEPEDPSLLTNPSESHWVRPKEFDQKLALLPMLDQKNQINGAGVIGSIYSF